MTKKLKVATCQFPVSASIVRNTRYILDFMKQAKRRRAELVHFSECALSGYAGIDHASLDGFDWEQLKECTQEIMALAGQLGIWVVLGSQHPLTPPHKPHNCLYLISPKGKIKDRYDKRFCMPNEQRHYSVGDHFVIFTVNKIRCALLICFDLRFPELYRELKRQKVDCIFQSFYNARQKQASVHTHIMRQTMQARAASNAFWVSMANSSARISPYGSCVIQPDGKIIAQLPTNRSGITVNTIDLNLKFYDPMIGLREKAMRGMLSSDPPISDARSDNRTSL
ncbi:MAG: carbon-nitrogen hydrolase family protein [Sedimentisphaerales bacterium]|nr:carbon-nitrogen hydrolase family protein [Sedimentisphaerales bacterium]